MLRALEKQLALLAADRNGSFERHIEARWGKKPPAGLQAELRDFVCLLPRIQKRIFSLYVWLPDNSKVKNVGSHFLTYMYQPDDFLPDSEKNGLFGYLDDAYLAALFYELMLEEIEHSKQFRLRKRDRELAKRTVRLRRKARAVIPDEAIKIKQMVGELFEGDETTFLKLFKGKTAA